MFISNSKVGEDSVILYKVIKTIRQINSALSNNYDRFSIINSEIDKLGGLNTLTKSR